MPRSLLAAIACSALLALLLSLVPTVGLQTGGEHIPVFQATKPVVLGEHNLVDLFTFAQTHYNIKRVKWESPSLYVDLVVDQGQSADLSGIYRDFYTLAYDAFLYTANVDRLYFRMLEGKDERSARLLVSIRADRPRSELTPPDSVSDIASFVEHTFSVRIEPYFRKSVSP
ncbi:hypothetical protein G3578_05205 [Brevibacillus sp. SYP-B805]|uniref:hypothetical protein n=1 Tax=Brevibacillus sp. SYP-B805 TaxID=1578199 RepID=UPI0013EB4505|nr:hypothetical protein [Brevibacillus sp. SYP-B805]NGQ94578.1 hypothetical protein [Brevibacillus sp. SYP-B805]